MNSPFIQVLMLIDNCHIDFNKETSKKDNNKICQTGRNIMTYERAIDYFY